MIFAPQNLIALFPIADSYKPLDMQQRGFFPPELTLSLLYQDLSATLLCKLGPGQSEIAEELCQRLQRKERMLQELLSDRNKQAVEHEIEIQGLLQSMSTREQESQVRTNVQTRRVSVCFQSVNRECLNIVVCTYVGFYSLLCQEQSVSQITVLHLLCRACSTYWQSTLH